MPQCLSLKRPRVDCFQSGWHSTTFLFSFFLLWTPTVFVASSLHWALSTHCLRSCLVLPGVHVIVAIVYSSIGSLAQYYDLYVFILNITTLSFRWKLLVSGEQRWKTCIWENPIRFISGIHYNLIQLYFINSFGAAPGEDIMGTGEKLPRKTDYV